MDLSHANTHKKSLLLRDNIVLKIIVFMIIIWAVNIGFVVIHEAGHCLTAIFFGYDVINVYINPLGLKGSTTHASISDVTTFSMVLCAGIVLTTIAGMALYWLNSRLLLYIIIVRTLESTINIAKGSDMGILISVIDQHAYAFMAIMLIINAMFAIKITIDFVQSLESSPIINNIINKDDFPAVSTIIGTIFH